MRMRVLAASGTVLVALFVDCRTVAHGAAGTVGIEKGPYLQNPTTNAITICWVSSADCIGTVHFGEKPADDQVVSEQKPATYHKVRIVGLKPYTRYHYTVLCERQKGEGSFLTSTPTGVNFKFAVYGDNRTDPITHASVLARMMKFQPDFVIQTGDIVANGNDEAQWAEFFRVAGGAMRSTAYFTALGNHEKNGGPYFHYFDVPREYSFDYGSIHFTALDSNRLPDEHSAQEEWLRKDLAAHQDAAWRIVFFHHTPYTCVTKPGRRELAEKLRARLEPIFLAGNVRLVLNGHDHDYQHHFAKGIHYVVTGGGGAPLYEIQPDTPCVKFAKMVHHYCEVRVAGTKMSMLAREPDGKVVDEFTLP
jgi:3',5'-cyclic AMP phosphodiesterase CpdA